jgi:hypothetical protein
MECYLCLSELVWYDVASLAWLLVILVYIHGYGYVFEKCHIYALSCGNALI